MKRSVLMLLFAGATAMTMAQSTKTVKGAVIDTNGNALPGAKVEATGGAETTVTDADGTFSLEVSRWLKSLTATYPGMEKKKISIKNDDQDFIFTMKESHKYWFVNAVTQYNDGGIGAGVMFGQLNKWGWYGKAVMDFCNVDDEDVNNIPTITAGVVKRISKPFYMYFGIGYTRIYDHYYHYYSYPNYYYNAYTQSYYTSFSYYSYRETYHEDAFLLEAGAMHRIGRFNLNYGVGIATDFDNIGASFHLGVGYSF